MKDRTAGSVATALMSAMAPLAACDEYATTAPEEPSGATAVEVAQVEADQPIEFSGAAWTYEFVVFQSPLEGSRFVYLNGLVQDFESFLADNSLSESDVWDDLGLARTHDALTWNDFELCADCKLELTEVVRLGDAEGAGAIERSESVVTWSEHLGYVVAGPTFLLVFDDDGRFVRRIGREGEGPGEFGAVADAHVVDGRLVALDGVTRVWSIFTLDGEFVDRRPYGHQAGGFVPVGGGRVVVVNRDRSPEANDAPLHLAHIDSGGASLHFGSSYAWEYDWRERPHADGVRGSVTSRPGTVWWGAAGSPRLQEWSVDDELIRVIEGELPWFPEVRRPVDRTREPPPTLLRSLALDNRDRLWMMARTADPGWHEVELERTSAGYQVPPARRADYMDTRLDVFELEERRHIGTYLWDSPYARLFNLGGEPAVSLVEYTEDNGPQLAIYRVGQARVVPTVRSRPSNAPRERVGGR